MEGAKISRRLERQRYRRCFWRWPMGHCTHWRIDPKTLVYFGECCHCGKHKVSLPPYAPRRKA